MKDDTIAERDSWLPVAVPAILFSVAPLAADHLDGIDDSPDQVATLVIAVGSANGFQSEVSHIYCSLLGTIETA
jgi:hypothetical protein